MPIGERTLSSRSAIGDFGRRVSCDRRRPQRHGPLPTDEVTLQALRTCHEKLKRPHRAEKAYICSDAASAYLVASKRATRHLVQKGRQALVTIAGIVVDHDQITSTLGNQAFYHFIRHTSGTKKTDQNSGRYILKTIFTVVARLCFHKFLPD